MATRIGQLMEFVESLETGDGIFKQSVLEGIEAMEHAGQEPAKDGIRRISGTKWAYIKNGKGISLGYDGSKVALDDDAKEAIFKNFKPPIYIRNLDSLFFGGSLIVSRYGRIDMPTGIELFIPRDNMPEEIKSAIFIAADGRKRNFISIRDRGSGEFQWGYLFGKWGTAARTESAGAGAKLILLRLGKPIAELSLPELARNEDIGSRDEFFTDPRDRKKYRIAKIGNQTWMADNLNWEGAGVWYDNKKANGQKYGRLYTWNEAMKASPPGWHLPSDEEWATLADFAGGADTAAEALKSEDWDGADAFGFSALPGGYCYRTGDFHNIGNSGYWWSATEGVNEYAYLRYLSSSHAKVYRNDYSKSYAFSVRLIKG